MEHAQQRPLSDQWTRSALLGHDRSSIPAPIATGLRRNLVLLDRDGTLNRLRPGYVTDPDTLDMLPGAGDAVHRLNTLGVRVVLTTNQRGVARGLLSEDQLVSVHRRMLRELAQDGGYLDGIQICGHEEGECECRKPRTGLIDQVFERAAWATRAQTILVGDSERDEGAADNARIDFVRIEDSNVGLLEKIEKLLVLCAHRD